jgi:hypothetical protein
MPRFSRVELNNIIQRMDFVASSIVIDRIVGIGSSIRRSKGIESPEVNDVIGLVEIVFVLQIVVIVYPRPISKGKVVSCVMVVKFFGTKELL